MEKIRTAVFDPEAFYPFRSLVKGPLTNVAELAAVEEFLRAIVLHDEMLMELQPFGGAEEDHDWTDEEIEAGGRMVIAAIGPTTQEYGLFNEQSGPRSVPEIELSESLVHLAEVHSGATEGSLYYKTHLDLLKRVLSKVQEGGSLVCGSPFLQDAIQTASTYPTKMFETLDKDWKEFGRQLGEGKFGPLVPPVLGIVLTRSASRDKIPLIVRGLRDEWAEARSKVWSLTDAMKTVRTLSEATEIEKELFAASKHFSPIIPVENSSRPVQVLWELFVGAVGGAITGVISGANPEIGAAVGVVGQAIRAVQKDSDLGNILFGRGAFDLAKRVRKEVGRIELDKLRYFLSDSEKKALGM